MAFGATVHALVPRNERTPDELPGGALTVDLGQDAPIDSGGARISNLADGQIEVDFDPNEPDSSMPSEGADEHYANLAEGLTTAQRQGIAQDIIEMVDADKESRRPWSERMARGLELLGVNKETGVHPPFKGASTVVHPLIAEALVQFQARALVELWPATGPAKGVVMGDRTPDKEAQAKRVEDYLNYQLTVGDKTYFVESDKLLFLVGFEGSAFRKCYFDALLNKTVARLVRAEHFIVPYSATTLEDAPRYTHMIPYSQQEMKRLQAQGFFLDVPLSTPSSNSEVADSSPLSEAKADAEGKTDPDTRPEDREHTVYEMNVDYIVPGFEDRDAKGKDTGIAYPYVITVERDTMDTLAIRRAWKPEDERKQRRIQVVHYPFIRGDGFYAYGLIHLAGGLGAAATGLLRVILDNAAWAALQGGFKSKDAKLGSNVEMEPGKWNDTDMSAEELKNSFYTPPFKEVPMSLFHILGLVTEQGQRLVSTTESTVGDAKNTGPVGTTVALIEQGSKIQTGIHKRLHFSIGEELQMFSDLEFENMGDEGYPYDVPGESRQVMRQDFDDKVDVVPVSDPNIFSQTQRIAIAQTELQLAQAAPQLFDMRKVYQGMLTAIRSPNAEEILPEENKVERCDPITENSLAMVGRPLKVFMDQAHTAHNQAHMAELTMAIMQKAPHAQTLQQVLLPHMAAHAAMELRVRMMQQLGVPLPPLDLYAERGKPVTQELPPQIENMVAEKAAQVYATLLQQLQQAQAQQQQAATQAPDAAAQQDMAHKDAAHQQNQQHQIEAAATEQTVKDQATKADIHRKDMLTATDIERKDATAGIDPTAVKQATEFIAGNPALTGNPLVTPRKLAVMATTLGTTFEHAVQLLMQFAQNQQNQGPAPLAHNPIVVR